MPVAESSKLKEVRGKITKRREDLNALFAAGGEDMDLSAEQVEQIRALNDELTALSTDADGLQALQNIRDDVAAMNEIDRTAMHPVPGTGRKNEDAGKSLGQMFVESDAYKQRPTGMGNSPEAVLDVGLGGIKATLFQRTAGWDPESMRVPGLVVPYATRPLQVMDLIPTAQTSQALVKYMEETTFTNAAAERAEGAAYAESAFALTEKSVTVQTVGTSIPITDEQLEDVAQAESYIDGRAGFSVMQRLDGQLINGSGVSPNIAGILNATGLQTQAKGTDPTPDAVYKAMTKVRVTGRAFPSAAIFHPNDWQDIRLLRTADGIYIFGSPSDAGPERIWGLTVVQSDVIAENTGLVGDFSPAMLQLYERQGLIVQVGYVNDDFTKGKRTVRAGVRVCLAVYRGAAFCQCTGI